MSQPAENRQVKYDPHDGYRISVDNKHDAGFRQQGTALLFELRLNRSTVEYVEVADFSLDELAQAKQRRLQTALEAIAHYLNVLGTLEELQQSIDRLAPLVEKYPLSLPVDWYLLDWIYDVGENKYLFANDKVGDVLIVCPDVYSEQTTLVDFNNQTPDWDEEET